MPVLTQGNEAGNWEESYGPEETRLTGEIVANPGGSTDVPVQLMGGRGGSCLSAWL